ncbi:putative IS256 family transposase [Bifidobacterium actinocoloniiforme DSM 22766]|uniref:Putative IS256 family transposase n=1 Tax=Bifidobacterium actinocoloniiforme DSM 22766 TaxID=1437605 RepID=A0A086Z118_9BIFI|nr:putative IS256 family transposase [Bifidobacterium actinocoloniiforme DSM 22766]
MRTNGATSVGRTRWRCEECGSSTSRTYDRRAADLRSGLDWLFSKRTLSEGPVSARTQQRRNRLMWSLMPPVPLVWEHHDVVRVDGIWLHRRAVVLIAVADGHVIGWRMARHEDSVAWGLLMGRIAAPRVLVCDGGGGIAKAMRHIWPGTSTQRRLFHIAMNVTTLTGMRPRLRAGRQLRRIAIALSHVKDGDRMRQWLLGYNDRETTWHQWLKETSTHGDGSQADTHQRLVKARNLLNRRIKEDTMGTFIAMADQCQSPVPTTNNLLESWNKQLRTMLRNHNGLSLERETRAICWCATNTPPCPKATPGSSTTPTTTRTSNDPTTSPGNTASKACTQPPACPNTTSHRLERIPHTRQIPQRHRLTRTQYGV